MINKLTLAAATIAAATSATNAAELNSSAYAGVQAGYSSMNSNATDNIAYAAGSGFVPAGTATNPLSGSSSKSGFSFGAVLGYTYIFENNFVLGAELYFGKNTGEINVANTVAITPNFPAVQLINGITSTTNVKHSFSFAPTILIGYKFTPEFLAAIKVGANISRFSVDNAYLATGQVAAVAPTVNLFRTADSSKFTKTGLDIGVRGEYAFTDNVSFTGDFTYTYFSDTSVTLSSPLTPAAGGAAPAGATHTVSIKPRFITARLGATYRF